MLILLPNPRYPPPTHRTTSLFQHIPFHQKPFPLNQQRPILRTIHILPLMPRYIPQVNKTQSIFSCNFPRFFQSLHRCRREIGQLIIRMKPGKKSGVSGPSFSYTHLVNRSKSSSRSFLFGTTRLTTSVKTFISFKIFNVSSTHCKFPPTSLR